MRTGIMHAPWITGNFPVTNPLDTLHRVFGYASFRGAQEEIIGHMLAGGDALVLMPTGAANRCATRSRPCCGRVSAWWYRH